MLYYLKQELIGPQCQKVLDGAEARWVLSVSVSRHKISLFLYQFTKTNLHRFRRYKDLWSKCTDLTDIYKLKCSCCARRAIWCSHTQLHDMALQHLLDQAGRKLLRISASHHHRLNRRVNIEPFEWIFIEIPCKRIYLKVLMCKLNIKRYRIHSLTLDYFWQSEVIISRFQENICIKV